MNEEYECKKSSIGSRKEAKDILKKLRLKHKVKRGCVYYCDSCQAWHTTGYSPQRSRGIRDSIRSQDNEEKTIGIV